LLDALAGVPDQPYYARSAFFKAVNEHLVSNLSAPEKKLLQKHLGEHDPEAEVCKVKGAVEPDSDLRDYENVP
jgi:type I restriction enzyme M protein